MKDRDIRVRKEGKETEVSAGNKRPSRIPSKRLEAFKIEKTRVRRSQG